MNKGNPLTKEEWKTCIECEDIIGKHSNTGDDNLRCRHCYNKLKYGVSDINNCFQGSVITIDE
mgnify:CR=1 FL=1|tara:strand:- start:9103 stop:9291 length:189 start_codon:yes stop_codon:yes gene_type:complete